uniref:Uncharacterized protein LOC104232163 n=1 Tax=Nicotiana sylvestris TaxID=4096 RepID=A0A1U7X1Q1_NICSY|nr:PREDICTED: uncharacterized protein LOC104232163 [Nicotiana sylvestris]
MADDVDEELDSPPPRCSIRDNFDITKINKAGFKLEYVAPDVDKRIYSETLEQHGISKIAMLKNGIILVRFETVAGKNNVLPRNIFHFYNKPFIVKVWNPDMELSKEEIQTVPIWIKLPGLDFKYCSPKGLSKIGSLVGRPLMVDQNTKWKIGLNFARLLLKVGMDTKLADSVAFRNEKGYLMKQKVLYDWRSTLCKLSSIPEARCYRL